MIFAWVGLALMFAFLVGRGARDIYREYQRDQMFDALERDVDEWLEDERLARLDMERGGETKNERTYRSNLQRACREAG